MDAVQPEALVAPPPISEALLSSSVKRPARLRRNSAELLSSARSLLASPVIGLRDQHHGGFSSLRSPTSRPQAIAGATGGVSSASVHQAPAQRMASVRLLFDEAVIADDGAPSTPSSDSDSECASRDSAAAEPSPLAVERPAIAIASPSEPQPLALASKQRSRPATAAVPSGLRTQGSAFGASELFASPRHVRSNAADDTLQKLRAATLRGGLAAGVLAGRLAARLRRERERKAALPAGTCSSGPASAQQSAGVRGESDAAIESEEAPDRDGSLAGSESGLSAQMGVTAAILPGGRTASQQQSESGPVDLQRRCPSASTVPLMEGSVAEPLTPLAATPGTVRKHIRRLTGGSQADTSSAGVGASLRAAASAVSAALHTMHTRRSTGGSHSSGFAAAAAASTLSTLPERPGLLVRHARLLTGECRRVDTTDGTGDYRDGDLPTYECRLGLRLASFASGDLDGLAAEASSCQRESMTVADIEHSANDNGGSSGPELASRLDHHVSRASRPQAPAATASMPLQPEPKTGAGATPQTNRLDGAAVPEVVPVADSVWPPSASTDTSTGARHHRHRGHRGSFSQEFDSLLILQDGLAVVEVEIVFDTAPPAGGTAELNARADSLCVVPAISRRESACRSSPDRRGQGSDSNFCLAFWMPTSPAGDSSEWDACLQDLPVFDQGTASSHGCTAQAAELADDASRCREKTALCAHAAGSRPGARACTPATGITPSRADRFAAGRGGESRALAGVTRSATPTRTPNTRGLSLQRVRPQLSGPSFPLAVDASGRAGDAAAGGSGCWVAEPESDPRWRTSCSGLHGSFDGSESHFRGRGVKSAWSSSRPRPPSVVAGKGTADSSAAAASDKAAILSWRRASSARRDRLVKRAETRQAEEAESDGRLRTRSQAASTSSHTDLRKPLTL